MKYAVIETGGKQYKVTEGIAVDIEKVDLKEGDELIFDKILLIAGDGAAQIGQPTIKGASVSAKIIAQIKGEKIHVSKFKAKARYRKAQGHRQLLTKVKIEKIKTA